MTSRILQQASELDSSGCGLRRSCGNELRAKAETARRIHQRDAVEVSIELGPNRLAVETKRDPGFVDLKLFGMKHAKTVPVRLTVKLRGGTTRPDWSRGCTLLSRTRGDTTELHGGAPARLLLARSRSLIE
jgi:hypothetical protein